MSSQFLQGTSFFLDLGHLPFTLKTALKNSVIEHGGEICTFMKKKPSYFVCTAEDLSNPTTKVKQAQALGIPAVELSFLQDCLESSTLRDEWEYLWIEGEVRETYSRRRNLACGSSHLMSWLSEHSKMLSIC